MLKNRKRLLEDVFSPEQLYNRRTAGGSLHYIRHHALVERLNDVYGNGHWSFAALGHQILKTEVIARGRLDIPGASYVQYGCAVLEPQKISTGDSIKAAVSNALLRCAALLGIGLYLRHPDSETQLPQPESEILSPRQKTYIEKLAERRNLTHEQLEGYCLTHYEKSLVQIDRQQASEVIDFLKENSKQLSQVA